jgi:hypothetical protein
MSRRQCLRSLIYFNLDVEPKLPPAPSLRLAPTVCVSASTRSFSDLAPNLLFLFQIAAEVAAPLAKTDEVTISIKLLRFVTHFLDKKARAFAS